MALRKTASLLVIFLFLGHLCSADVHYKTAVCTMIQNESRYIPEWIEYHRLLKVDHFFVYNDRSTDAIHDVLRPYIEKGIVTLMEWGPDNRTVDSSLVWPDPPFSVTQRYAIADCVYNKQYVADWIGVWDVDEFFYIADKQFPDIPSLISGYVEPRGWTSVQIPATNFGPSKHSKRPDGLIIDNYRWRSDLIAFGHIANKTHGFSGKSLYKSGCGRAEVHHTAFPPAGCTVGDWPEMFETTDVLAEPKYPIHLKHYWSKSFEDYYEKAVKWGMSNHLLDKLDEVFWDSTSKLNAAYDLDMATYVKAVTQALEATKRGL